jgi:hypothetical protein
MIIINSRTKIHTPGRVRFLSGLAPNLDPDAQNYINTAGFTNTSLIEVINNFYIDLKATGQYSKISLMKLFLTDSTDNTTSLFQCGINAVNPTANVPTYFNAPTANYSGIEYNGTTQYAIMNYNPINDTTNWALTAATIMGYFGKNVSGRPFGMRNTAISSIRNVFLENYTTPNLGLMACGVNDSTAGVTFTGLEPEGFLAGYRQAAASNNKKYFRNNNNIITQTGVIANGIPDVNLYEGGFTLDGGTTINTYVNQRIQFMLAGGEMTDTQVNDVQLLVNALQGDVDTLFGLTGTAARKRY